MAKYSIMPMLLICLLNSHAHSFDSWWFGVRYIFATGFIVILCAISFSQDSSYAPSARPVNNISINLLGDASFFSLDYERLFVSKPWLFLAEKTGLGYVQDFNVSLFGGPAPIGNHLTITQDITGNMGKGICFLELG